MLLIVSDTSVLIDIEQGELTSAMFSLPWQFAVPDILFASELAERHSHLLQCGLMNKTLNGDLVAEAYFLHQKYIRTSVNDMLALTLAKHESCQLLTGDRALREAAKELNVEVHGTIWLVEQMIQSEKITVEVANAGFQRMKEAGSRLPWGEVEVMLGKVTC
ncbi:MAG: hypothetical protein K0R48_1429 [Gammaproteobacteria bacterium]|jgi:rRNA-processing protein FCF1|nr:hypothetical protein [Gammaproteobacteria bacterium]